MNESLANVGKPARGTRLVKNVGTNAITPGQPVCYVMNGTDDGLAAAASNDALVATVRATTLFAGIAAGNIAVGDTGPVVCTGFATALCTTDGTNAIAVGTALRVATATAVVEYSAAGAQAATKPFLTACSTLAISQTGQPIKVWVNAVQALIPLWG